MKPFNLFQQQQKCPFWSFSGGGGGGVKPVMIPNFAFLSLISIIPICNYIILKHVIFFKQFFSKLAAEQKKKKQMKKKYKNVENIVMLSSRR